MEEIKRSTFPFRFRIPSRLVLSLRAHQKKQKPWRPLIDAEDVLGLYYGMGPAKFLTFDGRVLVDSWDWDDTGAYEVMEPREAYTAVVLGARGLPGLKQLLPPRPPLAVDCPQCHGVGWIRVPTNLADFSIVCYDRCGGLGWIVE